MDNSDFGVNAANCNAPVEPALGPPRAGAALSRSSRSGQEHCPRRLEAPRLADAAGQLCDGLGAPSGRLDRQPGPAIRRAAHFRVYVVLKISITVARAIGPGSGRGSTRGSKCSTSARPRRAASATSRRPSQPPSSRRSPIDSAASFVVARAMRRSATATALGDTPAQCRRPVRRGERPSCMFPKGP